ncbi:MAG: peptidylprolyl isomerase [Oscillospiraceae bacterium]|nr:peptidylprolyl isomerase [Oscillospiraceae bacterium]
MRCKYCKAELKAGSLICPECGKTNKEKDLEKRLKVMQILVFCLSGIILACVLTAFIYFGTTGSFLPGGEEPSETTAPTQATTEPTEPRVPPEDSYSVTVDELNTADGNKTFQDNRDTVVATMGEHTLTNRMLQVYYWDIAAGSSYADLDSSKPLDMQIQDASTGKTWQQYFVEEAIETWQRDMLVMEMANNASFEMPEVYASQFETLEEDMKGTATSNNYSSLDALLESMLGRGTTFETYYEYLWNYFLGSEYWQEYVKTVEVDMEQIEAYYEANEGDLILDSYFEVTKESGNLVDVRHILIQPKGGTTSEDGKTVTYSEAEWETCRAEAQAILDAWLAGEQTEEAFAALATEKTEDGGSKSTGGLYENVWKGMMVEEFEDWCFDETRKTGDYGLVKTSYGYHIMYFVDAEEGWIRLCTQGAQSEKASQIIDQMVEQSVVDIEEDKIVLADLK